MLSKNQRKQILQLSKKKFRLSSGHFVAEGEKVVQELLASAWPFQMLFATDNNFHPEAELVSFEEMKTITHFKTPSPVLGVFSLPSSQEFRTESITIAVDGVSDPGNLGTIVRLCDWFGLSELICSRTSVDCFNPKVIQASMGSIVRVHSHYVEDLGTRLKALNKPIFGAAAKGDSIYTTQLPQKATYVFGSESHGISVSVSKHLTGELSIPQFRAGSSKAESLNVATASAIFLSELFRNNPTIQK